jgi:hypothetical protein
MTTIAESNLLQQAEKQHQSGTLFDSSRTLLGQGAEAVSGEGEG